MNIQYAELLTVGYLGWGVSFSKLHISLMLEYFIGHVLLSELQGKSNYDTEFNPPCRPVCCGEAGNSTEMLRLRHVTLILALEGNCLLRLLKIHCDFADP